MITRQVLTAPTEKELIAADPTILFRKSTVRPKAFWFENIDDNRLYHLQRCARDPMLSPRDKICKMASLVFGSFDYPENRSCRARGDRVFAYNTHGRWVEQNAKIVYNLMKERVINIVNNHGDQIYDTNREHAKSIKKLHKARVDKKMKKMLHQILVKNNTYVA